MFILKKGHQPGVYVPLRALFLVKKASSHCYQCALGYRRFEEVEKVTLFVTCRGIPALIRREKSVTLLIS